MSDTEKDPQGPTIDHQKLLHVSRMTKRRHQHEAEIDRYQDEVIALHRRLHTQAAQHDRELGLVLQARQHVAPIPSPLPIPQSCENVSAYVEPYMRDLRAEDKQSEKTLESYLAAVKTFIKIVGDKPLLNLSHQDCNRFEDVIKRLPANSTKLEVSRNLSIDSILELNLRPMSIVNAKNIARRTNAFLHWSFRREGKNVPFILLERTIVEKGKGKRKKRRAFNDDELRIVFDPETLGTSSQASPYMFWIPLIGVHTGMRINEIAQLELSDLIELDGIACFNVTDEPDPEEEQEIIATTKKVKTEAGKRLVPIHDRLIDLGLLKYADALRAAGHRRLFPDLSNEGRDGPGQPASKQFARYCDRIKLRDSMLVFHSFRHGAVGGMRATGIHKELRMVVIGHNVIEDVHDAYGDIMSDHSPASKKKAIEALQFNGIIDYAALKLRTPTTSELELALARNTKRISKKVPA
jgi:integrase